MSYTLLNERICERKHTFKFKTLYDNFSLFGRQEDCEKKIRELRDLAPKLPTVPR